MRKLRKISSKYYFRQIVACWTICAMLLALTPARVAQAVPNGGVCTVGGAVIDAISNPAGVTVTINGMQTIIHWTSLNTTKDEFLTFLHNGNINGAVLNRVLGPGATFFDGMLNGEQLRIFMINPAGIVFGDNARINVAQLVASSLDILDGDFLDGAPYEFINGSTAGNVEFRAYYDNVNAERIFLIAKQVFNHGGLVADDLVVMAAGNKVLISENSPVAVEVDWTGVTPAEYGDYKVVNEEVKNSYPPLIETKLEAKHIILAAGDLWSQAITAEGIETVSIDVKGVIDAGDLAEITTRADAASDAVSSVSIAGGLNVTIDDGIQVEAFGDGVDDAFATIDVTAGADLTIESGSGGQETELLAHASGGNNNTAEVSLTAAGTFKIDAPDQVTVTAEAEGGEASPLLNQATVNIEGSSVLITATDLGISDNPATVGAYARDAVVNRAGVNIEATTGHVHIIGAGYGDNAVVEALSESGVNNYANVVINAGGDVDIIAREGTARQTGTTEALVRAEARMAEVSNDAEVDIDAGGDVHVKAEGGQLHDSEFTPFVAAVEAIAETAGSSNTALVDVTAGGDVVVLSKDGGQARIEAIAKYAGDSVNTANINLTAEDGYVLVHAIGGHYDHCREIFTPSEASVRATAEHAGDRYEITGSTNNANITIVAKGVPEEEECLSDIGNGDVGVVAVNGGKAEVEAKAKYGDDNTAGVKVTADDDVKVIAACYDQPSEAEIMALAKYSDVSNTALVDITAGGDVVVLAKEGGIAEITAIATDGPTNQADVDIAAGGDVIVKAEGGDLDEWQEQILASWDVRIKTQTETWDVHVKLQTGETWDVKIQKLDHPEYWKWKFKRNCGTFGPKYKYITTYEDVNPGNPTGYHYHSKDYYDAHYYTQWMNNCPEHDPVPQEYGWSVGWELAGQWKGHKTTYDYGKINNCPEYTPNLATYGFSGWTIYKRDDHKTTNSYAWIYDCPEQNPDPANYDKEGWWVLYANPNYEYIDHSSFTPSVASIKAKAENDLQSNTANILINAGDDVKVMAFDGGVAEMIAATEWGELNTSGVTINSNGDVKVIAKGYTETIDSPKATSDASIKAKAKHGLENTATIGINAVGGDVLVLGKHGGEAAITALAKDALSPKTNTAKVNIKATKVEFLVCDGGTPETEDDIYDTRGGNVKVIAKCEGQSSKAEIEALAIDGMTNNADVLICIDGGVLVKGEKGGEAEIEALAKGVCGTTSNTATVGIGAKGEEGVEVTADCGGDAEISSKAKYGETNTASTIVCTQGGVDVLAKCGGDAAILSQAQYGYTNDAYTGVCAVGDIVVQVGTESQPGCDAVIRAEATATGCPVESSADAETVVVSHEGNVEVLAYNHGHAGIEAEARGAHLNTAKVGVAAGADLTPAEAAALETGDVIVEAFCGGVAQILAWAHDAVSIPDTTTLEGDVEVKVELMIPGENTAQTVVCAPGVVLVETKGGEARIKSRAGWYGEEGSINKATTRVYASDVIVNTSAHSGQGIWAWAYSENSDNPHVPGNMILDYLGEPYDGSYYCMDEHGEVAWTDGDAVLYIQDYSKRVDCPECPPCPCEEEIVPPTAVAAAVAVPAPVAPLPVYEVPSLRGCPELMLATSAELGIPSETLQIGIGTALAHNSSIQPCQACASLVNAASILKDVDGSRMAAMVQVFNAMAPADAPYTPEMATSIAMAFEDAAEGSQYASAMEFIDAFVQYATALDELGSPVGDSMAFVMNQYGAGLGDNGNMATFVAGRIESR